MLIYFKEICPFLLAAHILESFETHHPLVLPEGGYQFQLGRDVKDPGLVAELDEMNEFISTLSRSQSKQAAPLEKQKVKKGYGVHHHFPLDMKQIKERLTEV